MFKFLKIFFYLLIAFLLISQFEVDTKINFHEKLFGQYYHGQTFHFQPNWFHQPSVFTQVKTGKKIAHNDNIIICGLARNIESILSKTRCRLEYIGQQFKNYKIICFENDSEDNTRPLLKEWSLQNPNFILLDCNVNSDCKYGVKKGYDLILKNRIKNMSIYREEYLKYIKKYYYNYEYLLVVDFDLNGNQCIDGLYHSLAQPDWDAIFINGKNPVFGTFGTLTVTYDSLAYLNMSDKYDKKKNIYNLVLDCLKLQSHLYQNEELYPVKSAFNGYGLYKMKSIVNSSYIGEFDCEHINFHYNLKKLYINPVWYGYFNLQGSGGIFDFINCFK